MRNVMSINLLGSALGQLPAFPTGPTASIGTPVTDAFTTVSIWGTMKEKLSSVKERVTRGIFSNLETINRLSVMTGPLSALIAGATVYLGSKTGVSVSNISTALGALKQHSSSMRGLAPEYRDIIIARTPTLKEESLLAEALGIRRSTITKIKTNLPVCFNVRQRIIAILNRKPSPKKQVDTQKTTVNQLISTFELYKKEGSLEGAGKILGNLSRQAIHQRLELGNKLGLFLYSDSRKVPPDISKKGILKKYRKHLTRQDVAKELKIPIYRFDKLLKQHNITSDELRKIWVEERKKQVLKRYYRFKKKAGHDFTTVELESSAKTSNLYSRILLLWGSIGAFREENKIVVPYYEFQRSGKRPAAK